mgnify:FL=1
MNNTSSNKDNFILAKKVKDFILTMEPLLENIPKKDLYNRDQIREELIDLLRNIYNANLIKVDKERKLYLQELVIVDIKIIDFYLERMYIYKYINKKQLKERTSKLDEINKITRGWIKTSA